MKNLYLKKVWEMTGRSTEFPLNCQRKKGQIYNIRPNSFHVAQASKLIIPVFSCREEFIAALYKTVLSHTNKATETRSWLEKVILGYHSYCNIDMTSEVNRCLRG